MFATSSLIFVLFAGAESNVSVVPLRVKLVVPSLLVALCIISLTNTVMVSVVVLRFVNVNSAVDPSPLKLSVVICSNIMLNGSR